MTWSWSSLHHVGNGLAAADDAVPIGRRPISEDATSAQFVSALAKNVPIS